MPAKIRRHAESTPTRRTRRRYGPDAEGLETRKLLSMMYQYGRLHPMVANGPTPGEFRAAGSNSLAPASGYLPSDIRHTYGFDKISFTDSQGQTIPGDGRGQTIAIVDAFDAPNIVADLHMFDQGVGLPDPPQFVKVNQTGGTTYPQPDDGWSMETALDVEWAHAIAPQANILLVESTTNEDSDMWAAVDFARRQPGVVAVSMSWGESEYAEESEVDAYMTTPAGHAGVTFLASSGDDGGQPVSPSTSPNAVAVGGTSLFIGYGFDFSIETGWLGSGGGISGFNPQPSYQKGVVSPWSTTMRTGPDVAYNADPWYGFAVYNSSDGSGWNVVGGTSAGTPQWAALVAIADQGRALKGLGSLDGPRQTLPALYQMPGLDFNDITIGSNFQYSCTADYDLVTGLGSPHADLVVNDLLQAGTASGPFTATGVSISATEGQAFSGAVASVRDTYTGDTASSLAARINWGDGTTSTGTIVSNGRGGFLVDGTHTYAVPGQYSVGITVTRDGDQSASANGTATVADAPLEVYGFDPLPLTVGETQTALIGWIIDGNANAQATDFEVTIDWGDGTSSSGRLVPTGYGWFDVYGDHLYTTTGTYNVRFTINDVGGSTTSATSSLTVEDAIWVASPDLLFETQGQTFTANVAMFSYGNPTAMASIFTAAINWGDGATSAGTVGANGYGGFNVVGQHAYARAGTYTIHVALTDIYGSALAVDATSYVYAPAQVTTTTGGRGLTRAVASPTPRDPFAIDPLGTQDPVGVLDEALASLGGASGLRRRWATT
jgi:hypothetical protein